MSGLQVVVVQDGSEPVVVMGDSSCMTDPCAKHGRCHCMCPCDGGDGPDDCADCVGDAADDAPGQWVEIGYLTE